VQPAVFEEADVASIKKTIFECFPVGLWVLVVAFRYDWAADKDFTRCIWRAVFTRIIHDSWYEVKNRRWLVQNRAKYLIFIFDNRMPTLPERSSVLNSPRVVDPVVSDSPQVCPI
jgi:hypothetical protein